MSQPLPPESAQGPKLRRLACDRCRGQKLKCVRVGSSESCQRCDTAKAVCTFGKPLPPGRPSATKGTSRETRGESAAPAPAPLAAFPPGDSAEDSGTGSREPTSARMDSPSISSFLDSQWVQSGDMDAENFYNMLYEERATADLEDVTFDPWPPAADAVKDTSVWEPMELANETPDPSSSKSNTSADHRVAMQSHKRRLIPRASTTESSSNGHSALRHKVKEDVTMANTPRLMQKLMQISCQMYELESRYCASGEGTQASTPSQTPFPTQLTGDVLQAGIDFLKFLQYFFFEDEPASGTCHHTPRRLRNHSLSHLSDLDRPSYHRSLGSYPPFNGHPDSPPSEWPSPQQVLTVDRSTILQLIVNYMRLLRLYLALHTSIYDYARHTALNASQRQPIWVGLAVGGIQLDEFSEFQIKLVLQVAARLLGDIESALGLTEGCRVGVAEESRHGILGMYVSTHFIEMCISESTTGNDDGREAIIRLREIMHRLPDLLDSPSHC